MIHLISANPRQNGTLMIFTSKLKSHFFKRILSMAERICRFHFHPTDAE